MMNGMFIEDMRSSEACIISYRINTSKWGLLTFHQKRPLETRYLKELVVSLRVGENTFPVHTHETRGDCHKYFLHLLDSICYFIQTLPSAADSQTMQFMHWFFHLLKRRLFLLRDIEVIHSRQMHNPPKLSRTAVCVKLNLYSVLFNKCQQLTLVGNSLNISVNLKSISLNSLNFLFTSFSYLNQLFKGTWMLNSHNLSLCVLALPFQNGNSCIFIS